jgi:hypothetical protein
MTVPSRKAQSVLLKGTALAVPKSEAEGPYHSAEGRSEARRAKRLIIAFVFADLHLFSRFQPKNRMLSPQTT